MRLLGLLGGLAVRAWKQTYGAGIWNHPPARRADGGQPPYHDDLFYIALLGPHV
jgi:hypothetical protein